MTWQPIETAPKDGTPVLGLFLAFVGDPWAYEVVFFDDGRWRGAEDPQMAIVPPDLWQPLPSLPEEPI